jgi:hypothetical protein
MMGKSQRDKGSRREREFAALVNGERVPLSGACGGSYTGDVVGLGMLWEVKARKDGFAMLYRWLEGNDALALKADRKPWLCVLPLERVKMDLRGLQGPLRGILMQTRRELFRLLALSALGASVPAALVPESRLTATYYWNHYKNAGPECPWDCSICNRLCPVEPQSLTYESLWDMVDWLKVHRAGSEKPPLLRAVVD